MLALVVRDVIVLGATIGLLLADARLRATADGSGTLAIVIAVAAGVFITVTGFYAHEWGHYLAARMAGARPVPAASPISIFLFDLREGDCTRGEWLAMSAGGYVATLVALPIILAVIDLHALSGQVALVLSSLGILATFGIEIPITYRVYKRTA